MKKKTENNEYEIESASSLVDFMSAWRKLNHHSPSSPVTSVINKDNRATKK